LMFEIQGHRGARGLVAENTLPSFEAAIDVGVHSVETDLRLTADQIFVLNHDPIPALSLNALRPRAPGMQGSSNQPGSLSQWFASHRGLGDPFAISALADLFAFAAAYAEHGERLGKTTEQVRTAEALIFDLEIKWEPLVDGDRQPLIENHVTAIRAAGVVDRCRIRCFDHRVVRDALALEPRLTGALLIVGIPAVDPVELLRSASASIWCPEYRQVDLETVEALHRAGCRIIPWTANDIADWKRLIELGVDGITTDYPDRLREFIVSQCL
jgi:glycerophosphoryl diester phosphodiesterase